MTSTSPKVYPFKIATMEGLTTFAELVVSDEGNESNLMCHNCMFSSANGHRELPLLDLCIAMIRQSEELPDMSILISSNSTTVISSSSFSSIASSHSALSPTSFNDLTYNAFEMQQLAEEQARRIAALEASQTNSTHEHITLYLEDIESDVKARIVDSNLIVRYSSKYSGGEMVNWVCEEGKNLGYVPRKFVHEFNLLHKGMGVMVFDESQNIFVHQRACTKKIFPSMYDMFVGGISLAGESSDTTLIRELNEELGIDLLQTGESYQDVHYIYASKDYNNKVQERINAYRDKGKISWEVAFDLAYEKYKNTYINSEKLSKFEPSISSGNKVIYLGNTICYTDYNHCFVDVYAVVVDEMTKSLITFNDGEIQAGEWMHNNALNRKLEKERCHFVPDGLLVFDDLTSLMSRRRLDE